VVSTRSSINSRNENNRKDALFYRQCFALALLENQKDCNISTPSIRCLLSFIRVAPIPKTQKSLVQQSALKRGNVKQLTMIFFFFLFLSHSWAETEASFNNCEGTRMESWHIRAVATIKKAQERISSKGINDPLVKEGLLKFFNLNVYSEDDQELIEQVLYNVETVAEYADWTNYKCHVYSNGVWCKGKNILGLVPPPKRTVHLCPNFFSRDRSDSYKAGVIMHEWFHRWGGRAINYYPEIYCHQFVEQSSYQLIRQSDQHVLFITYLASEAKEAICI
jgi:hypothetical protein